MQILYQLAYTISKKSQYPLDIHQRWLYITICAPDDTRKQLNNYAKQLQENFVNTPQWSGADLYSNELIITENHDEFLFLKCLFANLSSLLLLPQARDTNHSKEVKLVLDASKTAVEDSRMNMEKLKQTLKKDRVLRSKWPLNIQGAFQYIWSAILAVKKGGALHDCTQNKEVCRPHISLPCCKLEFYFVDQIMEF